MVVSQISFGITTVHILHNAPLCLDHNNFPQNLCSLMQLVAIFGAECVDIVTVFIISEAANLNASGL